jgi:3-dehydroquinate synthetase
MKLDKKAVSGSLKFILPEKIGKVKIQGGIPEEVVRKAVLASISS